MAITCTKCGVVMSMPGEVCLQCSAAITPTLISKGAVTSGTSASGPKDVTVLAHGNAAPLKSSSTVFPTGPHSPLDALSTEEEGQKVEELLQHIAAQSHFEDRYELRAILAHGGMGQVQCAYDRILRREVAIKMMLDDSAGMSHHPAVRGQFLKEARVGGRLLHPNILSVFDLGVNRAGQIYYTMRLVDGSSLQNCLDSLESVVNTKMIEYPLRKIIEAFVLACRGVDYAHQSGVLHLDLKPQNILVSGFQEVFVIDWGLARVDEVDDRESIIDLYRNQTGHQNTMACTATGGKHIVGTPGYMAPEQAIGDVANFKPATDVYGLGGVLYFILYGHAPNQGSDLGEIIRASQLPKKRGKLRSGILPRGQRIRQESQQSVDLLEKICLKALEPDPAQSYLEVESLIVDINDWLAGTPFK